MKNLSLILISLFFFIQINAQYCYTLYPENSIAFATPTILEIDEQNNSWLSANYSYGGGTGLIWTNGIENHVFTTSNSSIPNNMVNALAFGNDSVWVATESGAGGFNGNEGSDWRLINKTNYPSLPTNNITAIAVGPDGSKWLGTNTGEVCILKDNQLVVHDIAATKINAIQKDLSGRVWVGINVGASATPGIAYFENDSWTIIDNIENIKDIELLSNGYIAFNNYNSVFIFDGDKFNQFDLEGGYTFNRMVKDKEDQLWLNSTGGLVFFNGLGFNIYSPEESGVPANLAKPIAIDNLGNIFFSYLYTSGNDYCAIGKLTIGTADFHITPSGDQELCMESSLNIDAGAGFNEYHWSDGSLDQSIEVTDNGIYSVFVVDNEGCYNYDTTTISVKTPYEGQEICGVSVSTTSNKNIIFWEKTYNENIWYYNVYKETENKDEYVRLDSVLFNDLSVVVDLESDPDRVSDRYKISVVDNCGNESPLSEHHRTLHLSANLALGGGVNLIWEHYEGIEFNSYIIMRGTSPKTMEDIDLISSERTQYTDKPASPGTYYYQVAVELPYICDPTAKRKAESGPFNRSVSNLKNLNSAINYNFMLTDTTLIAATNSGTYVGDFVIDIDGTPITMNFSLKDGDGPGGKDNDKFDIQNNSLYTNTVFPYDKDIVYLIRVYGSNELYQVTDSFELKVNRLVSINENLSAPLKIYPQPMKEYVNIRLPENSAGRFELNIFDLTGKLVRTDYFEETEIVILRKTLKSGAYIIQIKGDENYFVRLMVE